MELHLRRFKLEILLSQLPCWHPNKTRHSDEDISDFRFVSVFVLLLFLSKKKKKKKKSLGHTTNNVFTNWQKIQRADQDHLTVTSLCMGFLYKKGSGWSGAKWVKDSNASLRPFGHNNLSEDKHVLRPFGHNNLSKDTEHILKHVSHNNLSKNTNHILSPFGHNNLSKDTKPIL